jgi:aspartyl protease family protein
VRRLLWLLLAALVAVLLVLSVQEDETLGGLSGVDVASLAIDIALIVVAGSLVLVLLRERFSAALQSALIWVAIALLLAIGYTYRLELKDVGDRVMAELVPGHVSSHGRTVEIVGSGGGFSIAAAVNGARVSMALDTGASSVVLTQEAARAAGLPLEVLSYTVAIDTANGRARAAPVTLDRVAVGGIVERSVPALIAQSGQLRTSLLGMSFLKRLDSWGVHGERLLMRGNP